MDETVPGRQGARNFRAGPEKRQLARKPGIILHSPDLKKTKKTSVHNFMAILLIFANIHLEKS